MRNIAAHKADQRQEGATTVICMKALGPAQRAKALELEDRWEVQFCAEDLSEMAIAHNALLQGSQRIPLTASWVPGTHLDPVQHHTAQDMEHQTRRL
jgi:hypothetical protein